MVGSGKSVFRSFDTGSPNRGDFVFLKLDEVTFSLGIIVEKIAGGLFEVKIARSRSSKVARLDELVVLSSLQSIQEFLSEIA